MTPRTREQIAHRLNRIAGQVAGLQKMVHDDRECVDILTQVAAVRSALDAVGVQLLTDHMEHCVAGDSDGKRKNRRQLIEEVRLTLSRFLR